MLVTRRAVWLASALVTALVSTATKLGPTLVEFAGPHGVHVGDVVVLAGCAACSLYATVAEPVRAANG